MFEKNIYIQRRERLISKMQSGIIILPGNNDVGMNYAHNPYHFRQDSDFLYFFGIDRAGLVGIIDIDTGSTTLFGDDYTLDDLVWMGKQPTLAELAAKSGILKPKSLQKIDDIITPAKRSRRQIHFLPQYRHDNIIALHEWLSLPISNIKNGASVELIKAVVALRSIKGVEEIAEMEEAVNITRKMHIAVMKAARPGMYESELAGIAQSIAIAHQGQLSYPIIMSKNGQILHNHYQGNKLEEGDLVLGDYGAENTMHYAGDITRTFPISKKFSAQQLDIYNIVLRAEMAVIEHLKPGVPYRNLHLLAAGIILDGLKGMGLIKGNIEDALQAGAYGLFFPHGLGHMIGLDVHDMEGLGENYVGYRDGLERSNQFGFKYLRLAKELESGFVLTVEPGIYFIPELIENWKSYKKHREFINYQTLNLFKNFGGIRIEDNCLISDNGYRVLGKPIPKTVKEIEGLRS